jgi:hypothetical protein
MLQEVNRRSIELVSEHAGLDWVRLAVDVRVAETTDTPVRQRGVALAGSGQPPGTTEILHDVPLPERTIHALVQLDGVPVRAASYHAPPGVSWFEKKPLQAVAFARWLATIETPAIFGADANTPLIDHPDFERTRTHWHTGERHLQGEPGDDLLWAATKVHHLDDALRRWLGQHPDRAAEIAVTNPDGPLAISHRTGKRRTAPGTPAASTASGSPSTSQSTTSPTPTRTPWPRAATTPPSSPSSPCGTPPTERATPTPVARLPRPHRHGEGLSGDSRGRLLLTLAPTGTARPRRSPGAHRGPRSQGPVMA